MHHCFLEPRGYLCSTSLIVHSSLFWFNKVYKAILGVNSLYHNAMDPIPKVNTNIHNNISRIHRGSFSIEKHHLVVKNVSVKKWVSPFSKSTLSEETAHPTVYFHLRIELSLYSWIAGLDDGFSWVICFFWECMVRFLKNSGQTTVYLE